ncbi:MAG: TetR/AcrR family transcriptional regulator [Deltaproteobacteria bacterium]|nr:TetR/AcrR family transcriptional regulator [Deltaproteobacteria bacterium]
MKQLVITQAAKELFLEHGYGTITVDRIAERAGVTKRTLYSHYPSKLALFVHVFDDYLQQLHTEMVAVLDEGHRLDILLRRLTATLFEFTKRNEKFMRLFWTLGTDEFDGLIPEELVNRIKMWNRVLIDEVVKVSEEPQNRGLMKDYDPELLFHLMSAINKGIFLHTNKSYRFKIASLDPEELYGLMIDLVEKGLFGESDQKRYVSPPG